MTYLSAVVSGSFLKNINSLAKLKASLEVGYGA
jgi:hypothetical protein